MDGEIASLDATVTRLGTALESSGDAREVEGILNPGAARARDGTLLLYPRVVAEGNISRIALVEAGGTPDQPVYHRRGYALEPAEPYEFRAASGGYGCEDARVTFVPALDVYLMAYVAFGPNGPRVAVAFSDDGYVWERLGLVDFTSAPVPNGDDKDAAFFPEPVRSPKGVLSIAFYHRPMLHLSAVDGCAAVPIILERPPRERECTRIAYVPLAAVLEDRRNLLRVAESELALEPGRTWGVVKNGAGTPPVRIAEGWLSVFHGVDVEAEQNGACTMRYGAGIVIHDPDRLDVIRYRSPEPILVPQTSHERHGTVNDVVFPTGIDRVSPDGRTFDIYYGMADSRVGRARIELGACTLAEPSESAA
jgi:predicted GH43/DUF377 family glycosyl hydrolase